MDPETRPRRPPFAPAAAIVLALTVLGLLQPFGSTAVRAAGGLVLGLAVVVVAAWINRRDGRRRLVADGSLFLGALSAGGLFGTGFIFLPLLHRLLAVKASRRPSGPTHPTRVPTPRR